MFRNNFCFTGTGSCGFGFNVDNGDIIGPRAGNLEYGWLNDSKDNMRCENRNTQDLNLGCHILFS